MINRSPCLSVFAGIVAFSFLHLLLSASASAVVIYENNFEDDSVGTYTVSNLVSDWGVSSNDGVDEGRVSITDDANAVGNKSLVVQYPQGESNNGKSQWKAPLGGSYDELYMSYKLRFDDNFDFVRGGKLPGLCGGECNSGGDPPDGFDGWSARMMWRTNGSGGSPTNGDKANPVQYMYYPDQPGTFAEDMKWDDNASGDWKEFESDVWYQLQHRIVMNTPGQSDGIVQAWMDGEMVLDRQDVRFRETSALKIDTLYFSTFFGGSSAIWEATKDEHVYYDDFVVSTEFINTSPIAGDFDGDGDVDSGDLGTWESAYGTSDAGDTDADLDSDGSDFLVWQQNYTGDQSSVQTAASAVPEPATLLLLVAPFAYRLLRRANRSVG